MKDKVKLFYLCMVLFIDAIGSGLVLPILPELYLNRQYGLLKGGDPHYTNIIYGVTLALFPLASLFGKYFFGALSDHFGRKKTIIVGLGLTLLSYLLSMVAVLLNNVWLFIFARFVTGFGTGTYTAVFAMIADVSKTLESKLNNFKWPALATVLGFIIGPILGGSFGFSHGQMAFIIPFVIGFLLTLVNIYKAKTSLDETFVIQGDSSFNTFFYLKTSYNYLLSLRYDRPKKLLLASYLGFQFAIGLYIQSISLYLAEFHHFTPHQMSLFYVVMGGGILFNTLFLQNALQKLAKPLLLITGLLLAGVATFFIPWISRILLGDNLLVFFIVSFVVYILVNLGMNIYTALLSERSSSSEQGKIISLTGQAYSLTWFVASMLVGVVKMNTSLLPLCMASIIISVFFMLRFRQDQCKRPTRDVA